MVNYYHLCNSSRNILHTYFKYLFVGPDNRSKLSIWEQCLHPVSNKLANVWSERLHILTASHIKSHIFSNWERVSYFKLGKALLIVVVIITFWSRSFESGSFQWKLSPYYLPFQLNMPTGWQNLVSYMKKLLLPCKKTMDLSLLMAHSL